MKKGLIILVIALIALLTSCTSLKNEIFRMKIDCSREELLELKKTSDENVTLSTQSALLVYAMNKYANPDGTFGTYTDIPLKGDRRVETVALSSSILWISYPKSYSGDEILPVIFFTHGGAYTSSDYKTYQELLGILQDKTNSIVFSIDYSLAPEHKFPQGANDVIEAYKYLVENGEKHNADTNRIILFGDSAGGNFAAGLAIRAKEEGLTEPKGVILVYPSLCVYPILLPSHVLFGGFDGRKTMISMRVMEYTFTNYLENTEDGLKPYASPLLMLEGTLNTLSVPNIYSSCAVETDENGCYILPDHLIIVSEADSLRDEGIMYHGLLTSLGTNSSLSIYKGSVHGFLYMPSLIDDAKKAIKEMSSFIINHTKEDNL